jgi:hypothetical protein
VEGQSPLEKHDRVLFPIIIDEVRPYFFLLCGTQIWPALGHSPAFTNEGLSNIFPIDTKHATVVGADVAGLQRP